MVSTYTELALYGSQKECAKTDNIFFPISEFCNGTVSLVNYNNNIKKTAYRLLTCAAVFTKHLDHQSFINCLYWSISTKSRQDCGRPEIKLESRLIAGQTGIHH